MKVPLLDLKAQYRSLKNEIDAGIHRVLESQACILGPEVLTFEQQINGMVAPAKSLAISSGTDALLIALMALDIGTGDEVIMPPFTFFATAAVVLRVGAKPVFVDVEEDSFNINPTLIESAITSRTKAIMPVHLFGQCADMERINAIAKKHHLKVIEDAAQALGATRNGHPAGAMSDIGCVSFYPTKNLGAMGEAGLVMTADPELFEKLRILRNQGMEPVYQHHYVGGNFRMDAFQGVVLGVKFPHLAAWNRKRAEHAAHYNQLFQNSAAITPHVMSGNTHIYHQYTIRVPQRDSLKTHLGDKGIATGIYYPIPLHRQPCMSHLGLDPNACPVSNRLAGEVLSLPIYPELSSEQVEYVGRNILEFLKTV